MSAHTPGPWTLTTVPTQVGHCHKIGPFPSRNERRPETHACVYVDGLGLRPEDAPELLANARLIAAAPDLLALLKELVDIEGPQPGHVEWFGRVQAAIAKAEGRQ